MNTNQAKSCPIKEGILLVDKQRGKTAFYLVHLLRKLSGIKKIGHAGILDPFATGVMVMLIGRPYTKLSDRFINHDKEYIATLKLGETTDTYDCDGTILESSKVIPSMCEVESVIAQFQGKTTQVPPMYSAKKINGQKLYKLARQGIEVERKPIDIELKIELLDYTYPYLKVKVSCSKGTYIRVIAHDMGSLLKTGAHLTELIRTRSGKFHLKDCVDAKLLTHPSFPYTEFVRHLA